MCSFRNTGEYRSTHGKISCGKGKPPSPGQERRAVESWWRGCSLLLTGRVYIVPILRGSICWVGLSGGGVVQEVMLAIWQERSRSEELLPRVGQNWSQEFLDGQAHILRLILWLYHNIRLTYCANLSRRAQLFDFNRGKKIEAHPSLTSGHSNGMKRWNERT